MLMQHDMPATANMNFATRLEIDVAQKNIQQHQTL